MEKELDHQNIEEIVDIELNSRINKNLKKFITHKKEHDVQLYSFMLYIKQLYKTNPTNILKIEYHLNYALFMPNIIAFLIQRENNKLNKNNICMKNNTGNVKLYNEENYITKMLMCNKNEDGCCYTNIDNELSYNHTNSTKIDNEDGCYYTNINNELSYNHTNSTKIDNKIVVYNKQHNILYYLFRLQRNDKNSNDRNTNDSSLPPTNQLIFDREKFDFEFEYFEASEETNKIKENILKIEKEIRKIEVQENKKEMLFFIDKCIECKEMFAEISIDINICPLTYNVNLGTRIYTLLKIDYESGETIFDVLRCLCFIDRDLNVFMKKYKVLQITGIIIHPLTKIKELSSVDKYVIVTNINNIDLGIDTRIVRNRNLLGFKNIGNTCFMNSSLQAIINCKEFADYFYSCDTKHLDNQKKLTRAFSNLIKEFEDKIEYVVPINLRNALGSKNQIYLEKNEQDAMEFLTDFLDIIHEELKIKKRSKKNNLDGYEKWQIENQSIVTNLFFTKLKSSILCSICTKGRHIYEPLLYLPVPVPLQKSYYEDIVIFYESYQKVPLKIRSENSLTIYELKRLLKNDYNVKNEVFFCQIINNTLKLLKSWTLLRTLKGYIFCYEYDKEQIENYYWIKINKKYFFWTSFFDFWILGKFDKNEYFDINENTISQPNNNKHIEQYKQSIMINLKRRLSYFVNSIKTDLFDLPLETFFRIQKDFIMLDNFRMCCFALRISNSNFNKLLGHNFRPLHHMAQTTCDIVDLKSCIQNFLKREYIFGDEKQLCSICNDYTIQYKDTELERLPKYLIVQLKRFRFTGTEFEKIETLVEFDTEMFYINNTKYKINGIINHIPPSSGYVFRANESNGHYTSYIRHQKGWYLCNDQYIDKLDFIDKKNAYIIILEKID